MNDKVTTRLRSRITTDGIDRAPHRVFIRGMGLDGEAMARPFIGVVTTSGEDERAWREAFASSCRRATRFCSPRVPRSIPTISRPSAIVSSIAIS